MDPGEVSVSIVMPCLNEADALPACIASAKQSLSLIFERFGLKGEIVIADNGSTDGGPALAAKLGARIVNVAEPGSSYLRALGVGHEPKSTVDFQAISELAAARADLGRLAGLLKQ
jgi:glycosyltransferase involved in cell wall biosynthesis